MEWKYICFSYKEYHVRRGNASETGGPSGFPVVPPVSVENVCFAARPAPPADLQIVPAVVLGLSAQALPF